MLAAADRANSLRTDLVAGDRMEYDDQNLFAKILRGEIPADVVYETEHVLAFRDISPQAPVHILVIPKQPLGSLADARSSHESALGRLMVAVGDKIETSIEMRAVEVLKTQGDYCRVSGMVQADERIVTRGLHRMTPGMIVQTQSADSTIGATSEAATHRSGIDR